MKLQVLMSAMNRKDHSILNEANIRTEAIIVNQCDHANYEKISHNGKDVLFLSFPERGVGLSRNNALMRSTADIVIFADEDVTYLDDYEETILSEFSKNPKADIILFNIPSTNPKRPGHIIKSKKRIRKYNCLKYGACKMAVRVDKIKFKNVYFSLLFGGGAKFSSGEDSLFLYECIRKGMKVYTSPRKIGHVSQEGSSWFKGYNDKFFIDKGVFYGTLSRHFSYILVLQYVLRKYKSFSTDKTRGQILRLMHQGIKISK